MKQTARTRTWRALLSAALALSMALGLPGITPTARAEEGDGTEYNPFEINTWDELVEAVKDDSTSSKKRSDESFPAQEWEDGTPTCYKLADNFNSNGESGPIVVGKTRNVHLFFNAKELNRGLTEPTDDGYVIKVEGRMSAGGKSVSSDDPGKITGGNNTGNGGGVYVAEGGVFWLRAGSTAVISGNSASNGGGVYVDKNGTFQLRYSEIDENKAQTGNGGGVYVAGGSLVMQSNSKISENKAQNGGGVYVKAGTVEIREGVITGNMATTGNGGGVYVDDNGSFIMQTRTGSSGSSATVEANTAKKSGGGVYVAESGLLQMTAGDTFSKVEVCNNDAGDGGGVYMAGGTFWMGRNSEVRSNTAETGNGGGVYVNAGTFTMADGTITENNARGSDSSSGGVYVAGTGKFQLSEGIIKENTVGAEEQAAQAANVRLVEPARITFFNPRTESEKIGVSFAAKSTVPMWITTDFAKKVPEGKAEEFFTKEQSGAYQDGDYDLLLLNGEAVLSKLVTVTFDPNGGTGSADAPATQEIHRNYETALSKNAFTREGYDFKEWNTAADGSGTAYADEAKVKLSEDATLYAIWELKPKEQGGTTPGADTAEKSVTVTFKVVNGSWDDGTTADKPVKLTGKAGDTLKLSADDIPAVGAGPSDGYKAGSWDTTPDTATVIDQAATYTYSYAPVVKQPVTVTLETGTQSPVTVTLKGKVEFVYKIDSDTEPTKIDVNNETVYTYTGKIDAVPEGMYSVVAEQNKDENKRTVTGAMTLTDKADSASITLKMPENNINTVVTTDLSGENAPASVAVNGLEQLPADEGGQTVTYEMGVKTVTPSQTSDAGKAAQDVQNKAIEDVKATEKKLGKNLGAKSTNASLADSLADRMSYLDITVTKATGASGDKKEQDTIGKPVEVVFPYSFARTGYTVWMWRCHIGETPKLLRRLAAKPTVMNDGEYWVDKATQTVYLYAQKYSIYAYTYVEGEEVTPVDSSEQTSPSTPSTPTTPSTPSTPSRGSSSSGGGSSVPSVRTNVAAPAATMPATPTTPTTPATPAAPVFSDTAAGAWYEGAVKWAAENKVMSGYGDGRFGPNDTTTRAMLAMILWNLEGSPAGDGSVEFNDVASGQWYAAAVRWAAGEGIVGGYDDANGPGKVFDPNAPVTREQLATMLYRYAQYKGYDVSVGEDTNILSYDDATGASGYAIPALQWAVGAGIVTGYEENGARTLRPGAESSRAVVATMLMRFCAESAK